MTILRIPSALLCVAALGCGASPAPPPPASPPPLTVTLPPPPPAPTAPDTPPAPSTPPAPPLTASAGTEAVDAAAAEIAHAVRRVSDTEYVLTRHAVETLFENAPALMRRVRVVPEKEGDKTLGLRLFAIHADSALAHLGIQSGDRVERLAGHDLFDPQRALEAYVAVKNARRAVLEITRHGEPMKIVYRVE